MYHNFSNLRLLIQHIFDVHTLQTILVWPMNNNNDICMFAFQSIKSIDSLMLDNIIRTMLQVNNIIMGIDNLLAHSSPLATILCSLVVRLANEVSDKPASALVRSACRVSGSVVLGRPLTFSTLCRCFPSSLRVLFSKVILWAHKTSVWWIIVSNSLGEHTRPLCVRANQMLHSKPCLTFSYAMGFVPWVYMNVF